MKPSPLYDRLATLKANYAGRIGDRWLELLPVELATGDWSLRAALGLMNPPMPPERAYDILMDTIGRIASLSDRHCEVLPNRMIEFLDRVDDASADYLFGDDEGGEEVAPSADWTAAIAELRAAKADWAGGVVPILRLSDDALSVLRSLRDNDLLAGEDVAFHDAVLEALAA